MSNQFTIHSAIGTAILKKPVKWGQYDVRFVLLLAITEEKPQPFLKSFFLIGWMVWLLIPKNFQSF